MILRMRVGFVQSFIEEGKPMGLTEDTIKIGEEHNPSVTLGDGPNEVDLVQ